MAVSSGRERRTDSPMRQLLLQRRLEAPSHRLLIRPAEQVHLERIERCERINQSPFVGTKALSQSVHPSIPSGTCPQETGTGVLAHLGGFADSLGVELGVVPRQSTDGRSRRWRGDRDAEEPRTASTLELGWTRGSTEPLSLLAAEGLGRGRSVGSRWTWRCAILVRRRAVVLLRWCTVLVRRCSVLLGRRTVSSRWRCAVLLLLGGRVVPSSLVVPSWVVPSLVVPRCTVPPRSARRGLLVAIVVVHGAMWSWSPVKTKDESTVTGDALFIFLCSG